MDSVPVAVERQDIGAPEPRRRLPAWIVSLLTVLAAVVLASFIAMMIWLQFSGSRVEGIEEPERALALIVGRTMDIDDAVSRAPAWEQFVYRVLSTEPAEDLDEGLRWYEELASSSINPTVDLHLAVLEGESDRTDSVRRRVDEWTRRPDPLPVFAVLVAAAYLNEDLEGELGSNLDETLAEALEPGWFRDRLAVRLATRVGDRDLLTAATAAQAVRSSRLFARMRATVAVELVLIGIGLVLLMRVVVRRRVFDRIGAAILPPSWRGRTGVLVLVWGGALGSVIILASTFLPDRAYSRVLIGATTNLSFVPLIVLAWWYLMRPSGRGFIESFGLTPTLAGARRLMLVILTLLALGQLGEGVMDMAGRWLGLSAHWTEWFDRDLVWGSRGLVGMTIFDTVVLTPVFEEIVFRGLLFATLRRRFGLGTAAMLSAAIFAVAHGYGVLGFAAVFWSGLLWAWSYERTGSLLPSMAAHAADNLMASLSVILVLRG
ncbi:MAG TPA: type II CAAX endopeptidase family protein [Gaiellaceae bacterium]|nr:type II CAAX endopeptidase family protein [Gaiellaceae bacterium]